MRAVSSFPYTNIQCFWPIAPTHCNPASALVDYRESIAPLIEPPQRLGKGHSAWLMERFYTVLGAWKFALLQVDQKAL